MNTLLMAAAIVALIAGAVVCVSLAWFGVFLVVIASDAGEKWWTVPLTILVGGLPACLAFFALRRSEQLARALLRSRGYLPEQRAEEQAHRPITGREFLTAWLVLAVVLALLFLWREGLSE